MRRTLMINLVFTLCKEQAIWISVLMRLIDDLSALDSIVLFGFSDRRLERTTTCLILETDIRQKDEHGEFTIKVPPGKTKRKR
ncbi:hypothetical protein Tco_1225170 [Tanacetum coccineum]